MVLQINYNNYYNYVYHEKEARGRIARRRSDGLRSHKKSFHLITYLYQNNCLVLGRFEK